MKGAGSDPGGHGPGGGRASVPRGDRVAADGAVAAIMKDCKAVHMMGGAHAKKFGSEVIGDDTLFGQVYNRLALGTCAKTS